MLNGKCNAPFQYRILPEIIAKSISDISPRLGLRHGYGLLDLISLSVALGIIICLTKNKCRLIAIGLLTFFLLWTLTWFRKHCTLPSVGIGSIAILVLHNIIKYPSKNYIYFPVLILCSIIQSFIRADIALSLAVIYFFYAILNSNKKLIIISFIIGIIPLILQYYISNILFPEATYNTDKFQLFQNFDIYRLIPFVLFMFPIIYGFIKTIKNKDTKSIEYAITLGSLFYLTIWSILGILGEVRIFLTFAFLLTPFIANYIYDEYKIKEEIK